MQFRKTFMIFITLCSILPFFTGCKLIRPSYNAHQVIEKTIQAMSNVHSYRYVGNSSETVGEGEEAYTTNTAFQGDLAFDPFVIHLTETYKDPDDPEMDAVTAEEYLTNDKTYYSTALLSKEVQWFKTNEGAKTPKKTSKLKMILGHLDLFTFTTEANLYRFSVDATNDALKPLWIASIANLESSENTMLAKIQKVVLEESTLKKFHFEFAVDRDTFHIVSMHTNSEYEQASLLEIDEKTHVKVKKEMYYNAFNDKNSVKIPQKIIANAKPYEELLQDDAANENKFELVTDDMKAVTDGNFNNAAHFQKVENWIYFTDYSRDELGILRVSENGTKQTIVPNAMIEDMNVSDGWIYYVDLAFKDDNRANDESLYRIRTDGTDKQLLYGDAFVANVRLIGNWIYFDIRQPNYDQNNPYGVYDLYKMKKNGEELTKVQEDVYFYTIVQDQLIYQKPGNSTLFVTSIDPYASDGILILDTHVGRFLAQNGWIYYIANGGIYRTRPDGSGRTGIVRGDFSGLNLSGDNLYYQERKSRHLYKQSLSTGQKVKLADEGFRTIITGGRIYYQKYDANGHTQSWWQMNLDGSGKEMIID
ncbi:MAG TPA: DUF6612 family protein [Bacillales bacterium]|nr:DUF6612 family protein [Bacillales bacterium]